MPPMKATGTNTAMIVKVVAITARPISAVPSRAASKWSLPRCRWRTMFSRTTIASSISRPIASERPISVSTLSVKPKARMTMKPATTETGSVRPVITVERQEFRNRNTIRTVSRPPISIVTFTSSTDSRMKSESSLTIDRADAGRQLALQLLDRLDHAVGHRHGVGARLLLDVERERRLLVEQRGVLRLLDAVDDLRHVAHVDRRRPPGA